MVDLRFSTGKLTEISVVIAAHLHVEHSFFIISRVDNEGVFEETEHVLADIVEFFLNLFAVQFDQFQVF